MTLLFTTRARRAFSCVAFVALGAGCTTWRSHDVESSRAVLRRGARPARVTLTDGRTLVLRHAMLAGDSVVAAVADRPSGAGRVALALSDVRRVETREVDRTRTFGAVLAGVATTALIAFFVLPYVLFGTGDAAT
jgi:hypothetical protein